MIETYVCPACQKNIEWDDSSCDDYIECLHCGERLRSPNAPMLTTGTVIGDYVIEKRLGVGGMGEVYLAEQQSMMRPVALKVLQPDLAEDKSYLERFYREVRTLALIEHPNIVKAIETGYHDSICYFSMSYINGKDLKEQLDDNGKMSEVDALHVILNVAHALQYVWDKHKLIHRDIKPANIILTDEHEVKLMDLGISKTMADNKPADLTMAGMMVGSPYYVSPEQARAEKDIDWRADMYSLGASFYHMIVGNLPFDSENAMTIIAAHLSKPIPDPRDKNAEITDRSANIIGQMMQKKKEDRFASWDDAIEAIEDAIEELAEQGASTSIMTGIPTEELEQLKVDFSDEETVPKHTASPDMVGKVKHAAAKSIFGNLYIRFAILVLLLFITFLSFFRVVKKSIVETRRKDAVVKYSRAMTFLKDKPDTKQERIEAYNLLIAVKKVGDSKYSKLADGEIEKLRQDAFSARNRRQSDVIDKELQKLKDASYKLSQAGKLDEAIRVWRRYKMNGAFADELEDEISSAVEYLQRQKRQRTRGIE